jgi:hypothetical protein
MNLHFQDRDSLLIWLFLEISEYFKQTELPLYTERFSNNFVPFFTDAELLTCGIFAEIVKCRTRKDGHDYLQTHYGEWFPALPCYEVYNRKLNKFSEAVGCIYRNIARKYGRTDGLYAMIDTEPIEVCQSQHSRHAKAGQPFVSKGYCAAKNKYYVGAKLQLAASARPNRLPFPFEFALATAAMHDLEIARATLPFSEYHDVDFYSDLAYQDGTFQLDLFEENGINIITPIKKKKGQTHLSLFQNAANSLHSSKRQPVDALFGWINRQTNIQNASRIRSVAGLFSHVCLKMAAALILMITQF